MKQNSVFRKEALNALEGNWGTSVILIIVFYVITMAVSWGGAFICKPLGEAGAIISNLIALVMLPMSFAIIVAFLKIFRKETVGVAYLFAYYKEGRVWTTMLLKSIYTILWTLLLIIPGIIKSYSYAMTEYIMKDDQTISNNAAIEKSMAMMQGKKMKLFLLDLSFIGWIILAILTFGLGFLLLMPYMYTARAAFYEDLKAELEAGQTEEVVIKIEE